MLTSIFVFFIVILAIQYSYYFTFFIYSITKEKKVVSKKHPISVIICAKNEAKNLDKFLPSILNQKYEGTFEVVIINDRSIDNTPSVLEKFSERYNNIKIVNVEDSENFWGNKKYALTLGIKAAKHEHLLFIDADCKPVSEQWISEMTSHFSDNKSIVLGYGAYEKKKHSFLNKLIRYETLLSAIQYFSYAKAGNPYMGVGRNLAYTKSDFFRVKGFIKHIKVRSGDDDLFINEVATKENTNYCLSKNSFTSSIPKQKFSEWIQQKRRHISTSKYYKTKDQFLLGTFYSSQLLFWFLSILLIALQYKLELIVILIAIRFALFYLSIGLYSKKLNEKDLIILAPITEITLIFIQLFVFLKNKVQTPKHW